MSSLPKHGIPHISYTYKAEVYANSVENLATDFLPVQNPNFHLV